MSVVRQLLKSALAMMLPMSRLLVHGPRRSANSGRLELALTLDDGPHPEWTPATLDALAETRIKATFFVIGERAAKHPHLIRRIVNEGHELGNHTWSHADIHHNSVTKFIDEVRRLRKFLQDTTGQDCRLIRPPRGLLTIQTARALWREQQTIVLWNVDPKDFAMHDESEMHRWLDDYRPTAGDVVLLHDTRQHAPTVIRRLHNRPEGAPSCVLLSDWLTCEKHATVPTDTKLQQLSP